MLKYPGTKCIFDRLLDTVPFTMHCYSLDWHPQDHISFIDNVHMRKLSYESKITDPGRAQTYDTVTFEVRVNKFIVCLYIYRIRDLRRWNRFSGQLTVSRYRDLD